LTTHKSVKNTSISKAASISKKQMTKTPFFHTVQKTAILPEILFQTCIKRHIRAQRVKIYQETCFQNQKKSAAFLHYNKLMFKICFSHPQSSLECQGDETQNVCKIGCGLLSDIGCRTDPANICVGIRAIVGVR
jgi:hypothetical protein